MDPLLFAAQKNHSGLCETLLESKANVNKRHSFGETTLIRAATHGSANVIRVLLQHGADVTLKNNRGEDALFWARGNMHPLCTKLLVKNTPSRTHCMHGGTTAFVEKKKPTKVIEFQEHFLLIDAEQEERNLKAVLHNLGHLTLDGGGEDPHNRLVAEYAAKVPPDDPWHILDGIKLQPKRTPNPFIKVEGLYVEIIDLHLAIMHDWGQMGKNRRFFNMSGE